MAAPLQPGEDSTLDTMSWRLLQQTAAVLGLLLQRQDTPGKTTLRLEFPQTLAPSLTPPMQTDRDEESVHNTRPLAGRHVLVLAGRREVRNVVREALRPSGWMIDFVTTVEEAQALCADGLPHAVVYHASLGGERFERLRSGLLAVAPKLAFIQIAEEGKAVEVLNVGGRQLTSVGRDAIIEALAEALTFELSRNA